MERLHCCNKAAILKVNDLSSLVNANYQFEDQDQ